MSFQINYHQKALTQTNLSEKTIKSIEKRKKLALLLRAKDKIEDYQNEVFEIIDNDGLKHNDDNKRLKTALDVLKYITPVKKQSEVVITTRKIEDLIQDDIEEAEIIDKKAQSEDIDKTE